MSSEQRTKALFALGIIKHVQTASPPQVLALLKSYRHPTTGLSVTLTPIMSVGSPTYWNTVWYNNHVRYDGKFAINRIIVEDGYMPVATTDASAWRYNLARRLCPILPMRVVVPPEKLHMFCGAYVRDRVESQMSYESTVHQYNPPVDPRARRAMEQIEGLQNKCLGTGEVPANVANSEILLHNTANLHIVLPWNVYHMAYFIYKLNKLGFQFAGEEEVVVTNRNEIVLAMTIPLTIIFSTVVWLLLIIFGGIGRYY